MRHNLSSSRAFLKGERCGGERGKGFFWSVDDNFAQTLEEQEIKAQQAAAAAAQGLQPNGETKGKKKDKNSPLEPALKRSIKGDTKGAPLPPPLTSSPLALKTTTVSTAGFSNLATSQTNKATGSTTSTIPPNNTVTTGAFPYPSQFTHPTGNSTSGPNPYATLAQSNWGPQSHLGSALAQPAGTTSSTVTPVLSSTPGQALASQPAVPDVIIPIVLGPIPPTHPDYAPRYPNNSIKEGYMVLHERKLILDPGVFGELTTEMLEQLEKMGAPTALSILTGHMIRALKERRARERGKDRGVRRPKGSVKGVAVRKSGSTNAPATASITKVTLDQSQKISTGNEHETKQIPDRTEGGFSLSSHMNEVAEIHSADIPLAPTPATVDHGSPLIDIDGESEDEGPAAKKRKLESDLAITSG